MLRRLGFVASVAAAVLAATIDVVSSQQLSPTKNKATDNPTSRLKVHVRPLIVVLLIYYDVRYHEPVVALCCC
jgi:hypothetical protein